jgi:3-phosphoshikimate 1-carboxyvinyltransferase
LRALAAAALADGESTITGALDCDDSRNFIGALRSLGVEIDESAGFAELKVNGVGGKWPKESAELNLGDCGTGYRFAAAFAALGPGPYTLTGSKRLMKRPMGPLIKALRELGAEISEKQPGPGPITVKGGKLSGRRITVEGEVSSQFLSALLLIGPKLQGGFEVATAGRLVSEPYVDLTLDVMRDFGVVIDTQVADTWCVMPSPDYAARDYAVEPDASSAAYWFAAAAITGGSVTVSGIPPDSKQADLKLLDVLLKMGCVVDRDADGVTVHGSDLRGVSVDMSDAPDAVPALAVVAAFAGTPTEILNIGGLRHKESDRISTVAEELGRARVDVRELEDGLVIIPSPPKAAEFESHNDHRIAMSMALIGLTVPGVKVRDPEVVSKSYPGFWDDLNSLT